MEEKRVIGPDGLDLGRDYGFGTNIRRKFRWIVKLFKDGNQVNKCEFVRLGNRPPSIMSVLPSETWSEGGELTITFFRINVESFDEMWLGLIVGNGQMVEEWELRDIKVISSDEVFEDEEDKEIFKFSFGHFRYKSNV